MTKYADRRLCVCNHEAADHTGKYPHSTSVCLKVKSRDESGKVLWCPCQYFKLDNLKYIEQKYDEKHGKLKRRTR